MTADFDPVESRREAMIDHLASWDLDGAMPDGDGLRVIRRYVAGEIDLDEMILEMSRLSVLGQEI